MRLDDFIPFVVPVIMYLFGGNSSFIDAFKMFTVIIIFGGFFFGIIAINAGHHHPEVVHDGDPLRLVLSAKEKQFKENLIFFSFSYSYITVKIWIGVSTQ